MSGKGHLEELNNFLTKTNFDRDHKDTWIWEVNVSGNFSVNSAYKEIHLGLVGSQVSDLMKDIWWLKVQPKAQQVANKS